MICLYKFEENMEKSKTSAGGVNRNIP